MTRISLLFVMAAAAAWPQWSGSGSNGSDGALNLGADTPGVSAGVLIFDPVAWNIDIDGDNIFHFTTITVRDNITVRFLANRMRHPGPVVFLASGAVNLQGRLDLRGESGHIFDSSEAVRRPAIPGPGGYPGGVGAKQGGVAQAGFGPGGGRVANPASWGCPGAFVSNVTASWCAAVGASATYGNALLQPLVGGSGGSGVGSGSNTTPAGQFGAGGGAGGGAIRISSSVSIAFGNGLSGGAATNCSEAFSIIADGGSGGNGRGGPGTGGAAHLQAPVIAGCGTHIHLNGGPQGDFGNASPGRARLDGTVNGIGVVPITPTTGPLVDVPLPTAPPRIRIVSVNGANAPANPQGGYTLPDVLINTSSPVPVVVNAANIPVNTPVTLFLSTETGQDLAASQVNLTGTIASSTATVNVTIPLGVSRLIARAVW